jgi:hypothetical protein
MKAAVSIFAMLLALAFVAMAILAIVLPGCDRVPAVPPASADAVESRPAGGTYITIPPAKRVQNYGRNGACLYAAAEDLLRWQGLDKEADYWRRHFRGGANAEDVARIAERRGLDYAWTESGDESFLDWCAARRLGAAIYWLVDNPHDHAIVFCGWEDTGGASGTQAVLLGTNRPEIVRMPRAEFLRVWRLCDGGAFTFVPTVPHKD